MTGPDQSLHSIPSSNATPSAHDETDHATVEALVYTIPEAAELLRIGRTSVYGLMDTGQLASIKIGTRRLITRADLETFIDNQRRTA